jgi:hypothetical protein
MEISDADVEDAEQRMRDRLASTPHAISARYDRRISRIVIALSNGLELALPPHLAEGLAHARAAELADIEITPSGLGLHWPKLDADLYLPSLMEGIFGSPRWMDNLNAHRVAAATNLTFMPRSNHRRFKQRKQPVWTGDDPDIIPPGPPPHQLAQTHFLPT